MLNFLRRSGEDVKVVGTPIVEFVPVWKVRGFHECYYLRTNSYRVNVRDDVVGVEVEGRSRDLILERKQRHFIPAAVVHRFQRLGSFLLGDSKYFVISNATELAAKRSQSELAITGAGRTLDLDQYSNLTAWRSKRIFDSTELKVRGARVQVREPAVSKEDVLKKFREEVIHMPERFKQILSSRLHVTEMRRVYIPLIRISVQKGLVPREIVVNGTSGFNETVERNRTAIAWFNATLDDERNWTEPCTFTIAAAGLWKVQFLLFRDADFAIQYRSLHLFVKVGST